jgi:hypothetical protein
MGKSVYDAFKTDASAETDGIELNFGELGKFNIARAGGSNRRYEAAVRKRIAPHQSALSLGVLQDSVARALLIECYADAVVLGWSDVCDELGSPIPFSRENCIKLFTDLPDLFALIQQRAQDHSNFLAAKREAAAGN